MMMYLSKGMIVPPDANPVFRICRWGKIHALGPEAAELWRRGCTGPAAASEKELTAVRRLAEAGLLSTTEETSRLAAFRLLNDCVLCPSGKHPRLLWGRERRIWTCSYRVFARETEYPCYKVTDGALRRLALFLFPVSARLAG